MDEKYFWPLAGVVLGWSLTFFASNLKDRAENRQRIGRLLSKLVALHSQLKTQIRASEGLKSVADNWEGYEKIRGHVLQRYFMEPPSFIESLNDSIDEIAGTYPLRALALLSLFDVLHKSKIGALPSSSKSEGLYVRLLSVYEVGLDVCEASLKKHIRYFALRHGVVTFVRVTFDLVRREKREPSTTELLNKFAESVRGDLRSPKEEEG